MSTAQDRRRFRELDPTVDETRDPDDMPSYISDSTHRQPSEDVERTSLSPLDPRSDPWTKQSDLGNALEIPKANLERYENAAKVAREGLETGQILQPGWAIPEDLSGGSSSSSSASPSAGVASGVDDAVQSLGSGLSGLASAGGAILAIAIGILAAIAWGESDA